MHFPKNRCAAALVLILIFLSGCGTVPSDSPAPSASIPVAARDDDLPDLRTQVIVAGQGAALSAAVDLFNVSSNDYRAVLRTYSDSTALLSALSAGTGPDVLQSSGSGKYTDLPLTDLRPLLDQDAAYFRTVFPENLLTLLLARDTLYDLPCEYGAQACEGPASLLRWYDHGITPYTAEKLAARMDASLLACAPGTDAAGLLSAALPFLCSRYVNFSERTCAFDSPAFADLITAIRDAEYPAAESDSTSALLQPIFLGDADAWAAQCRRSDESSALVGFPDNGSSGCTLLLGRSLSIPESCTNRDGAEAFLRFMLSADAQALTAGAYAPVNPTVWENRLIACTDSGRLTTDEANIYRNIFQNATLLDPADSTLSRILSDHILARETVETAVENICTEVCEYLAALPST